VERFDLFLVLAAPSLAARTLWLPSQKFGNGAGLALIVFGTAIIAIAATCFLATAKAIDGDALHGGPGSRFDLAPAVLLGLFGCALFIYLAHALVTRV
jgi:putative membrane protein